MKRNFFKFLNYVVAFFKNENSFRQRSRTEPILGLVDSSRPNDVVRELKIARCFLKTTTFVGWTGFTTLNSVGGLKKNFSNVFKKLKTLL